jgi:hypothetical protein
MRWHLAALSLCLGRALGAQAAAQLDVEAAAVRAEGFARAGGLSAAPAVRLDAPHVTLSADGVLAVYGAQRYTGRLGAFAGAHATARRFTGEVSVAAARLAFRQESEPLAGVTAIGAENSRAQSEIEGRLRGELALGAWSVWGTGARAKLRTGPTRQSWDTEAGIQRAFQRVLATLALHASDYRTVSTSGTYRPSDLPFAVENGFASTYEGTTRHWQRDMVGGVTVLAGRAEVSLDAGVRTNGRHAGDRWATVAANWRLDERLTLIGSAGSYPSDPVRALPGASFATLGLRVQRGRAPFEDWYLAPDLPAFRIDTIGGGGRVVRVRAPRAIRMELTGDFTDWTTLPMRAGRHGEWEIVLPIAPGTYHVSVRVDGGRWRAPPGLVPVVDEFGTEGAVIVVR